MKFESVKLGDLYEVHNGLSKGRQYFGEGYPFLSFSTVFNNWFLPESLQDLVRSDEKEQKSYSIHRGDVFITRTSETMDELGMSSVALKDYQKATYNGFVKRLRPIDNRVLPEYIGYYLRTPNFRSKFMSLTGSMISRASLRNESLLDMEVLLPSIEEQQKIASYLSVYDDLIENNQRQITLLEESVNLIFNDWDKTNKATKGILSDIAFSSGQRVTTKSLKGREYYLPIDCLPKKSLIYTETKSIEEAKSSLVGFDRGDILFGAMRPYFHKVVFARDSGVTRNTCFVLNAVDKEYWYYLLLLLFSDYTIKYATSISVGATMPYVRIEDFMKMEIDIPNIAAASVLSHSVEPIFNKLSLCVSQINHAKETREILMNRIFNYCKEVNL